MSVLKQIFTPRPSLRQIRTAPDDLVLEADEHLRQAVSCEDTEDYAAMTAYAAVASAMVTLAAYLRDADHK
ncbi:hypothetical protein ACH4GK_19330 [Streptomyces rimosus]|uniref:hypothetical protein n=1 Tax=Streptomyces rimosus TaxID=1927 RepID=UPI0004C86803|nr:hypothetical protein [Streptomyces rimosus]